MDLTSNDLKDNIPFIIAHLSQTDQWNLSRTCKYMRDKCHEFYKSDAFCNGTYFGECVAQWHTLCMTKRQDISSLEFEMILTKICSRKEKYDNPRNICEMVIRNTCVENIDLDGFHTEFIITICAYANFELYEYMSKTYPKEDEMIRYKHLQSIYRHHSMPQKDRIKTIKFILAKLKRNASNGRYVERYIMTSMRQKQHSEEIIAYIDFVRKCQIKPDYNEILTNACARDNDAVAKYAIKYGADRCMSCAQPVLQCKTSIQLLNSSKTQ